MHALLEFLPLATLALGFFLGKAIAPAEAMYYLAYGAIIGTLLQFAVYRWRQMTMSKTTLITGVVLIIFATITVVLRNKLFIQLKPTVLSWGFALFFWGYAQVKKRTLLELMMGEQFELPTAKWFTLNWAWIAFNGLVGVANLFVVWQISRQHWDESSWLVFKGALVPVSLVFIVGQSIYLLKHGKSKHADQQEM